MNRQASRENLQADLFLQHSATVPSRPSKGVRIMKMQRCETIINGIICSSGVPLTQWYLIFICRLRTQFSNIKLMCVTVFVQRISHVRWFASEICCIRFVNWTVLCHWAVLVFLIVRYALKSTGSQGHLQNMCIRSKHMSYCMYIRSAKVSMCIYRVGSFFSKP